VSMWRSRTLLA
jgi:hypothetical protein